MNFKFKNGETPTIFLENIFDEKTLNLVQNELELLTLSLKDENYTKSATRNGIILKKNKGIFLNNVYTDFNYSVIAKFLIKKIINNKKISSVWEPKWLSQTWKNIKDFSVLISYYEDGDYYNPHTDGAVFTVLVWIWKDPKQFTGGDLQIGSPENIIKCMNNCGIIFPSGEMHAVTPIKLENSGNGRYCITLFLGKI
jgi:Rps23 Pro-64 3,4-dihydroxylase Tpa1-like proline 4-hydroxylase